MPVLAAAIGIYLPLETMVPIFIGGLLNYLVTRSFGKGLTEEEAEKRNRKGMLFAAGLITGEALMGILMAIPIVAPAAATCLRCPKACSSAARPAKSRAWRCSPASAGGCTASATARRPEGNADSLRAVTILAMFSS